ncbi:MFS transporter [Macrococcus equipercicus]|uniref:MFS transporter n=1 Tax=Macrococcus equipercicus TaxID=69967 RepID=A0A9Q9F155_9STAP|nr:MFS transporter [Macrococcus equipercicus]KAA1037736.1 MFS transporter [Macrococcus equipercicus]UTH13450.1 MFS transporter [Macrococcus equipercicus]
MKFSEFPSNVKLRICCGFFDHAASMSVMPFMVLYIADELGKVTSGLLLSINVIFGLLCNLLGGYFADRFSRKGQLLAGQMIFAVIMILMTIFIHPHVNMPWVVAILFMLTAISNAMVFPALEALIIDSTTEDMRKSVYVTTYWANNLATAVGTAIGGLFYRDHRLMLFILIIVIMLINTFIFKKYLIDPTTDRAPRAVTTHWMRDLLSNYQAALKDTRFVFFTMAAVFIFSAEFALTNYIGVRLHDEFKPVNLLGIHVDGVRMMSLMLIENTLLVVSITFLVAKVTEKSNQLAVLMLGAFMYTGGYGLAHHLTNWYLLLLVVLIATIGELMQTPILSVFQAKLMPEDKRASYIAFGSLGYSGAGLVASSGLIVGTVLNSTMMSVYVISLGLIGMLLLYLSIHSNFFKQQTPS